MTLVPRYPAGGTEEFLSGYLEMFYGWGGGNFFEGFPHPLSLFSLELHPLPHDLHLDNSAWSELETSCEMVARCCVM